MLNKSTNASNLKSAVKTFNDGICQIYSANERVLSATKGLFRYCNESVGISQYWQAYINNVGVDKSISVPVSNVTITTQDVVLIDNEYYSISRVQYHDNAKPFYWTLSLSKARFSYEVSNGN